MKPGGGFEPFTHGECVPGLDGLGRVGDHTGTGPSFSDPQPSMEQNSGTGDTAPGAGLDKSG